MHLHGVENVFAVVPADKFDDSNRKFVRVHVTTRHCCWACFSDDVVDLLLVDQPCCVCNCTGQNLCLLLLLLVVFAIETMGLAAYMPPQAPAPGHAFLMMSWTCTSQSVCLLLFLLIMPTVHSNNFGSVHASMPAKDTARAQFQ